MDLPAGAVAAFLVLILQQMCDRTDFLGRFLQLRDLLAQNFQFRFFAAQHLIDVLHGYPLDALYGGSPSPVKHRKSSAPSAKSRSKWRVSCGFEIAILWLTIGLQGRQVPAFRHQI